VRYARSALLNLRESERFRAASGWMNKIYAWPELES
jgi:hypothetical protein